MAEGLHLLPRHREEIEALLRNHLPGIEVWVYGSRVNGRSHDGSDLDLVMRGPDLVKIDASLLAEFTEALRESTIPFLVEARDWARLPESFHREIERGHVALVEREERGVVGGWCTTTIGEVVTLQRGFDLPATKRKPGNYLVIASTGAVGTHNEAVVRGPGVVIGRSGSLGGGQFIKHDFWPLNTTLWVKDFKGNDSRFCYFLFKSLDLAQFNAGSGVPTLNRNHVHPLPVSRPPLPEQRAIAHILGTLDDKIELNRRMNETLEAMARVLFKSWFVDFDPVRAKMEGRDPGLPKHIADLFPDRLVDSELGEIPEGWMVSELGDMIELAYGKALKAKARNSAGGVPVFGSNGQIGWHSEALIERPGIVVGRKGNPGTVTLSPTEFFPIDTTFYVVPKNEHDECLYFLFFALREQNLPSVAADSAVPGLNRNLAYMNKQLRPPTNVAECFDGYVSIMYARFRQSAAESRLLVRLRDTLLPKLVSGELRVNDAKKQAETVA